MSTVVDNKVVELSLENKQFEKNAQQSIATLQQLQYALNISTKDTNQNLNTINKTLLAMPLQGIANGVDEITNRFNLLGQIGFSVVNNLSNRLTNMVLSTAKSLTVGQKAAGWGEYQLKMNATKTIISGSGESLEKVNEELEKLNEYADKTIYSFANMTQNIGKFTNAGVKLEKAVGAIKGVSSLAAVSGQGANEASRAMYNFAQSLSMGHLNLLDWKSIENANMATMEFKNQLIETGLAMGTLVKQGDKYISTTTDARGHVSEAFDAQTKFRDSLSSTWITSEVLTETLARYADEETEIGKKAMKAATEVRTFSIMMDALKEASGSGWSHTFELIFGDLNESTKLWTAMNDKLTAFLDKFTKARNEPLEYWKNLGGRDILLHDFEIIGRGIKEVTKPISDAWNKIFPPKAKSWIMDLTVKFDNFVRSIKTDSEVLEAIGEISGFIFRLFRIGINTIKALFKSLKVLNPAFEFSGNVLRSLVIGLGQLAKKGNAFLDGMSDAVDLTTVFSIILSTIVDTVKDLIDLFTKLIKKIFGVSEEYDDAGKTITKSNNNVKDSVRDTTKSIKRNISDFSLTDSIGRIFEEIKTILSDIPSIVGGTVRDSKTTLADIIRKVLNFLNNLFSINTLISIRDGILVACEKIVDVLYTICEIVTHYIPIIITLTSFVFAYSVYEFFNGFRELSRGIRILAEGFRAANTAKVTEAFSDLVKEIIKGLLAFGVLYLIFNSLGIGDDFEAVIKDYLEMITTIFAIIGLILIAVLTIVSPLLIAINTRIRLIGSIKQVPQTLANSIAIFKVIDETLDAITKTANAIVKLTTSAVIFAAASKKFDNFEDVWKKITSLFTLLLTVMGLILGIALTMVGGILQSKDPDKAGESFKIVGEFFDSIFGIVDSFSSLIKSVLIGMSVFMVIIHMVSPIVNKETGERDFTILKKAFDFINDLIGFFITMLLIFGGSGVALAMSKYGTKTNNVSDLFNSISNVVESIAKSITSILKMFVVIALLNKIVGSESVSMASKQITHLMGAFATIAVVMTLLITLIAKFVDNTTYVQSGKDVAINDAGSKFETICTTVEKLLTTITKSIITIIGSFAILAILNRWLGPDILDDAVTQFKWIAGGIAILLGIIMTGIAGITYFLSNATNGNIQKTFDSVSKIFLSIGAIMLGVFASIVALVAIVDKSDSLTTDDLIGITLSFALIFVLLDAAILLITNLVKTLNKSKVVPLEQVSGLFKSIALVLFVMMLGVTMITSIIAESANTFELIDLAIIYSPLIFLGAILGFLALLTQIKFTDGQVKKFANIQAMLLTLAGLMTVFTGCLVAIAYTIKETDAGIIGAVVVLGITLLTIIGLASTIGKIAKSFEKVDTAGFAKAMIALGAVTGIITLLIGIIVLLENAGITPEKLLLFSGAFFALGGTMMLLVDILGIAAPTISTASTALTPFILTLLSIAGVAALFGAGVWLIADGFNKLVEALDKLSEVGIKAGPALAAFFASIANSADTISISLARIIVSLLETVLGLAPLIAKTIFTVAVVEPIRYLTENMDQIVDDLKKFFGKLMATVDEHGKEISNAIFDSMYFALRGALVGLIRACGRFMDLLTDFVVGVLDELGETLKRNDNRVRGAMWNLALVLTELLVESVGSALNPKNWAKVGQDIANAVKNGFNKAFDINSPSGEMKKSGKYMLEGLEEGFDVKGFGEEKANEIIDETNDTLGIHSPSIVFNSIGSYMGLGLISGFETGIKPLDTVIGGVVSLAENKLGGSSGSAIGAMFGGDIMNGITSGITNGFDTSFITNGISGMMDNFGTGDIQEALGLDLLGDANSMISDIMSGINSEFDDMNPTITPVVDMTNITNSMTDINSMFGSVGGINLGSLSSSMSSGYSSGLATSNASMFNSNTENAKAVAEARAKASRYDDSTIVQMLDIFNSRMQSMASEMANTQVVLDNGVLVGQMVGPMDQALGAKAYRNVRERG